MTESSAELNVREVVAHSRPEKDNVTIMVFLLVVMMAFQTFLSAFGLFNDVLSGWSEAEPVGIEKVKAELKSVKDIDGK